MLIYCDSVILIYYLDSTGTFHTRAAAQIATLRSAGDEMAISDLSRLEIRLKPLRIGDVAKASQIDAFFLSPDVRLVSLSAAVYDRATLIRAHHNFKLAD